jgi:hypothetical protein
MNQLRTARRRASRLMRLPRAARYFGSPGCFDNRSFSATLQVALRIADNPPQTSLWLPTAPFEALRGSQLGPLSRALPRGKMMISFLRGAWVQRCFRGGPEFCSAAGNPDEASRLVESSMKHERMICVSKGSPRSSCLSYWP